ECHLVKRASDLTGDASLGPNQLRLGFMDGLVRPLDAGRSLKERFQRVRDICRPLGIEACHGALAGKRSVFDGISGNRIRERAGGLPTSTRGIDTGAGGLDQRMLL